jgi:antitoxin HicB
MNRYTIIVEPLADEDGGGWLAIVPALPGCVSDGETEMKALRSVLSAIEEWKDTAKAKGQIDD